MKPSQDACKDVSGLLSGQVSGVKERVEIQEGLLQKWALIK